MNPTGHIHAANPAKSKRLQAVLEALRRAGSGGLTTRDLIRATGYCAINSIASELREGGFNIPPAECEGLSEDGGRIYRYRLLDGSVHQGELFGTRSQPG